MDIKPLAIEGAFLVVPRQHVDERGSFEEFFKAPEFEEAAGRAFDLRQANCSTSRRGVLRGIHGAAVPPGQAKYVLCAAGVIFDVVVDLRVGSPTFGQWDGALLNGDRHEAVFIAEGLGHGFVALADGSVVTYLCTDTYRPEREFGVNPYDSDLAIAWPDEVPALLSRKDATAPSLREALSAGTLPSYDDCRAIETSGQRR